MNEAKKVLVVIAASRTTGGTDQTPEEFQMDILPRITAKDVLKRIGIRQGRLKKAGEGFIFGEHEEIYPRVETGDKLIAVPKTPVAK